MMIKLRMPNLIDAQLKNMHIFLKFPMFVLMNSIKIFIKLNKFL